MGYEIDQNLSFRGMSQDHGRHEIGQDRAWNLVDFLPEWGGAALVKRGGWKYYSGVLGSNTYLATTFFAPYTTGPHQVSFDNSGVCFFDSTSKGTQFVPRQAAYSKNLLFYSNANSARTINSSGTTANVSTAPHALYSATWGERVIAGNTSASSRTLYFSAADDPTTWDTSASTGAWFNMSQDIVGVAVANGVILCFSNQGVERLIGSNPPPGGNLTRRWLADHGCIDYRSIKNWGTYVVWCDIDGVYLTDGASVTDITAQAAMKQYFINMLSGYTSSYTVAGGVYQDKYIVSVMNGSTVVDCLCFDLLQRFAYRFSNMPVVGFSGSLTTADEMYLALRSTPRIGAAASMWYPAAAVKADANGTSVTPSVELPFSSIPYTIPGRRRVFNSNLGSLERIRNLYLAADVTDAASDNPILTVSYVSDPASTAYTAVPTTFSETTGYSRARLPFRKQARGFGFKIAQTNASASTKIYSFGFEGHVHESTR